MNMHEARRIARTITGELLTDYLLNNLHRYETATDADYERLGRALTELHDMIIKPKNAIGRYNGKTNNANKRSD